MAEWLVWRRCLALVNGLCPWASMAGPAGWRTGVYGFAAGLHPACWRKCKSGCTSQDPRYPWVSVKERRGSGNQVILFNKLSETYSIQVQINWFSTRDEHKREWDLDNAWKLDCFAHPQGC